MGRNRLQLFVPLTVLSLMLLVGCETTTNTNHNANMNNNANVNSAASEHNANSKSPGYGVSREDFEKNKDSFAKQAKDLGRKIGSGANDLWIWSKTRAALTSADDLRDSTIDVDVENDVVTLSGTVPNAEQKMKAEQVVKTIDGVKSVTNNIQVAQAAGNRNAR